MSSANSIPELENGLIPKRVMDHKRQQILQFWSEVKVPALGAGKYLEDAAEEASEQVGAVMEAQGIEFDMPLTIQRVERLEDDVASWASKLVEELVEKVLGFFKGVLGEQVRDLAITCLEFLQERLLSFIPFVQSGKKILKRLKTLRKQFLSKFDDWQNQPCVRLAPGHTKKVIRAISSSFDRALLGNLAGLAADSAGVAFEAASVGTGTFALQVASAIVAVTKFLWRGVEIVAIKKFIKECKRNVSNEDLYGNKLAFAEFIAGPTMMVPTIAALTLKGGNTIGGDAGFYMQFSTDEGRMTQEQFDATEKLITKSKTRADVLLGECGYKIQGKKDDESSANTKLALELAYTPRATLEEAIMMNREAKVKRVLKAAEDNLREKTRGLFGRIGSGKPKRVKVKTLERSSTIKAIEEIEALELL